MSQQPDFGNKGGESKAQAKVQAIATEYAALKWEIHGRSRDQFLCISAALAAAGVVLGVVANNPAGLSYLLLVLPWILGVTAILWCDHAAGIRVVAKYLEEEIEQDKLPRALCELPNGNKLSTIGSETWFERVRDLDKDKTWFERVRERNPPIQIIIDLLPWAFFFVPSLLSIVVYWYLALFAPAVASNVENPIIGGFLTLLGLIALAAGFMMWLRTRREIKTPRTSETELQG